MSNVPTKCSALIVGEMAETTVTQLLTSLTLVLLKKPHIVLQIAENKGMEDNPSLANKAQTEINRIWDEIAPTYWVTSRPKSRVLGIR